MRFERWFYKLPLRLRSLFRRGPVEQDLQDEIGYHLERQIEENIAHGMTPDEARYAASRTFNGVEQRKEECRDVRGVGVIESVIGDLRYALRMIRRNPGFTLVTVLSLGLGIGANTAIFSAMDALVLRRLPVVEPSRLIMLRWSAREYPQEYLRSIEGGVRFTAGGENETFSYSTFRQLRDGNHVLSSAFAIAGNGLPVNLAFQDGAEPASVQGVSGNYFEGLGIAPVMGRAIRPEDDNETAPPVVVLSHHFWQAKFAEDQSIIGSTLTVDGQSWHVIGIAPPGFFGLEPGAAPDLWVPLSLYAIHDSQAARPVASRSVSSGTLADPAPAPTGIRLLNDPKIWWLRVVGRLKPGVAETQGRSELAVLFSRSLSGAGNTPVPETRTPRLDTLGIERGLGSLRSTFFTPLLLLLGLSGMVLLIACANVAGLLLARSTARQKEIAIRISLGVGRARLIRQLLTEHLVLAGIGGAAGLLLGAWAHAGLVNLLVARSSPDLALRLDARVLAFTMAVSVLSGVLFGLAPAIRATRIGPFSELRAGRGPAEAHRRLPAGKLLVAGQVAVGMLLLIVAGLFLRTLQQLYATDLGFDGQHLVLFTVRPGANGYTGTKLMTYYEELQQRIKSIPGIRAVSFATRAPVGGGVGSSGGTIAGIGEASQSIRFLRHEVAADYFETLGIALLQGRAIASYDGPSAPRVAVINQKTARAYFQNANPIGHRINFGSPDREYEIVGVVKDAKYNSLRDDNPPTVYLPYGQYFSPIPSMTFVVRGNAEAAILAAAIQREARAVDKTVPVVGMRSEAETIDRTLSVERTFATLSSFFGLVALLLACVGLYGTMAYAVTRRTYEIGIRLALGAAPGSVLGMILKESIIMVAAGIAIGLPVTLAITRLFSSRLFGITAADPITIVGATSLMLAVAGVAGFVPALRASRVSPMVALRSE